jgi:hypothetical protein
MLAGYVLLGNFLGTGPLNAIFATILLIFAVGLSLSLGVLASYWAVRVILHAFGTRAGSVQPVVVVERARAAAAGD